MKIVYATDLDRTLIFSKRFLESYNTDIQDVDIAEMKNDNVISYISPKVKHKLSTLNNRDDIEIIPVTTRSIEEYNRVDIGINTKYAIVSCGGTILKDGNTIPEWEDYVNSHLYRWDLIQAKMDLEDFTCITQEVKIRDNKFLFTKISDKEKYDIEIAPLIVKYPNLRFIRQGYKVYGISNDISKEIALRWLYKYLNGDKLVASGDGELDLGMLAIANYAIIPEHSDLIKEGYVTGGRIANAGIDSPLYTIELIENLLNGNKVE